MKSMKKAELIVRVAKAWSNDLGSQLSFQSGAEWAYNHPLWYSVKGGLPPRNEKNPRYSIKVVVSHYDACWSWSVYDFERNRWWGVDFEVTHWKEINLLKEFEL